ncbi:MAG TPA: extradiol ring-cleavage dioxygenase [Chloroflexota bacterium]|nr:extradiol ring-cleavage dioxygenase [Chloroflexota bacterium]
MGRIVAALASSHAFALEDPSRWDAGRARNRAMYARRYGVEPPNHPQIAAETLESNQARYAHIRDAFAASRQKLAEVKPDVLLFIGDDQNENLTEDNLPQVAIYLGDHFLAGSRDPAVQPLRYECAPAVARAILTHCVESDIDMASIAKLPGDVLKAHAFGPVLRVVDPEARVPVIPIFVNAIHVPAPTPARCYYLGETLRSAVEQLPGDLRVAVYASGGLSHFTGGYPWKHYEGPFGYGSISESFDHWLIERMNAGDGRALAEITNKEIIANGEIELRSWITMLGAIGDARPERLVYEPFYQGIMGMGVGCWDLHASTGSV